jgi:hypothetical protein
MPYRLHMEKTEKEVLDLEPIAPAAYWMGVGVAAAGVGYGVGYEVQSLKR